MDKPLSYQQYIGVFHQYESVYFSHFLEPVRDWLRPQYGDEAWIKICDEVGITYRQRSVSHALVSLCVYHEERTASLWMRQSGNFNCYGCGSRGDMASFILTPNAKSLNVKPGRLLKIFGCPPDEIRNLDQAYENMLLIPSYGQMILEGFSPLDPDEEPF